MDDAFAKIGKKWETYGLRGIWRNDAGDIFIDDGQNSLGVYYFGLAGDIESAIGQVCRFKDMPAKRTGLEPLWTK